MTQTTNQLVLDAISTKNVDLMTGIAATYTDLSDADLKALLFSGSLKVVTAVLSSLPDGSTVFAEVAQRAVSVDEAELGIISKVFDDEGAILDAFVTLKESCGAIVEEEQPVEVRFAMDNIAKVILGLNLDGLDAAAVTEADVVLEIEKTILSNQNAPEAVVTPYLESSSDVLRAKAFVHSNTNNDEIVAVMTAEDIAGNNIDGFKLAMIADLNSDVMIQGNDGIVAYLLSATQSTPVQFAMFKNYVSVVLNGGTTVAGIDTATLIATYVK